MASHSRNSLHCFYLIFSLRSIYGRNFTLLPAPTPQYTEHTRGKVELFKPTPLPDTPLILSERTLPTAAYGFPLRLHRPALPIHQPPLNLTLSYISLFLPGFSFFLLYLKGPSPQSYSSTASLLIFVGFFSVTSFTAYSSTSWEVA